MRPRELKAHLEQAKPLLLDVREPWEYRIARLEGSRLIPMRDLLSRLHELDAEQETVVICHHGIRSRQVAYVLERYGFKNVINLEGGLAAWAQEVDPAMPRY